MTREMKKFDQIPLFIYDENQTNKKQMIQYD